MMTTSTDPDAAAPAAAPIDGRRPRWRRGPLLTAVALGLALLLGVVVGLLMPRLTTPGDNSVEAGFLRDMSTHHAQAVEMSMIAHADSTNPDVITLADDIALTQQAQIGYMQSWLRDWHLSPTGSQPVMAWMPDSAGSVVNGLMPGMATPEQIAALRTATGTQLDIQYLTLMRQHHLGGIHMAQEAVRLSHNQNVDWLAQTMVVGQQGEIALITDMLKKLGAS